MPKVPEFPVKLVYGVFPPEDIKVPEFIKDDPKKGKISDLFPKFELPELSKKNITVKEVKEAKDILRKAMELDPDIKKQYEVRISSILFRDLPENITFPLNEDRMRWCKRRAEKITNMIFYGNEKDI